LFVLSSHHPANTTRSPEESNILQSKVLIFCIRQNDLSPSQIPGYFPNDAPTSPAPFNSNNQSWHSLSSNHAFSSRLACFETIIAHVAPLWTIIALRTPACIASQSSSSFCRYKLANAPSQRLYRQYTQITWSASFPSGELPFIATIFRCK
jgi:hypothetical protein